MEEVEGDAAAAAVDAAAAPTGAAADDAVADASEHALRQSSARLVYQRRHSAQ